MPNTVRKIRYGFFLLLGMLLLSIVFFRVPDIPIEEIKEKYADDASRYIDINGQEVHFKDEGSGPILILLHGTAASLHTWDGWVAELKDSFRIIRMDLPAYGLTGPSKNKSYSIREYEKFISAFTKELGIDTFHLAGNSLGGRIAWSFASSNLDRVNKLILIDPAGFPTESPAIFKLASTPYIRQFFRIFTSRSLIKKNLLEVYGDDSKVTDQLVDRYYDLSLREGNREAFLDRAKTRYFDKKDWLKSIIAPTLIMWGEEDKWIPMDHAQLFMDEIYDARLISYPSVGHVPMEEIPNVTAQDARNFLRGK